MKQRGYEQMVNAERVRQNRSRQERSVAELRAALAPGKSKASNVTGGLTL
jgi:hypothetical protein